MTSTILVIEDDPSILHGLTMNLELEGYSVLSSRDGLEGVSLLEEHQPDLVLLDIMLPKSDGFKVLRSVREGKSASREVPIIVLSARGEEADKLLGLGLGADDYVTKPFSLPELLARIRNSLRRQRRATAPARVYSFDHVEVDFGARRLMIDGKPVETTTREYELLSYFLLHDDIVVSRSQILQAVWGTDLTVTERTVDNFVARLRLKIDNNPLEPQHLFTIRGVGYRFTAQGKR